ncbi:uncharacterized protein LOC119093770 [Pollicipes pollicipes]|uniref:uncharacterized protein LOC119093770 n=1 Tax=Pollicipes pollicipes TaxID=41117 RepID=UPI001885184C|nr:uncharacterized protein LOC119093770 [Pollicipes pollicipes]
MTPAPGQLVAGLVLVLAAGGHGVTLKGAPVSSGLSPLTSVTTTTRSVKTSVRSVVSDTAPVGVVDDAVLGGGRVVAAATATAANPFEGSLAGTNVKAPTVVSVTSDKAGVSAIPDKAGVSTISDKASVSAISGKAGVPAISDKAGVSAISDKAGVSTISDKTGVSVILDKAGVSTTSDKAGVSDISDKADVAAASPLSVVFVPAACGRRRCCRIWSSTRYACSCLRAGRRCFDIRLPRPPKKRISPVLRAVNPPCDVPCYRACGKTCCYIYGCRYPAFGRRNYVIISKAEYAKYLQAVYGKAVLTKHPLTSHKNDYSVKIKPGVKG